MSNSIERVDALTAADIDWSTAPEGATHYNTLSKQWFALHSDGAAMLFDGDMWRIIKGRIPSNLFGGSETIKRPESIHDVARSIEAARVEEQACMPWPDGDPRYFETSDCYESLAVKVCADQPAAQVIDPPILGNQSWRDAIQIADAATQHMRDRAATYDQPEGERSMCRAVDAFNSITGRDLAESEGWLLLQLLKDARQWSNAAYHQDSAEDCIAYAALKAEALERGR